MKTCCFLQGLSSFFGNDICFIHAIGCSFWVCIWAPLTYSIIGQYLNILNCYKCWCHTFCYIFMHKIITCIYLEMKFHDFSHRIYYALMNCVCVISINNMKEMSNSIDSSISEQYLIISGCIRFSFVLCSAF